MKFIYPVNLNVGKASTMVLLMTMVLLTACIDKSGGRTTGTVYEVTSISMEPALSEGTNIAVVPVEASTLEFGDIVMHTVPPREDEFHVKRLIGLPGDTVEFSDNILYVNGNEIQEEYITDKAKTRDLQVTLDETQFFVLGDNRMNSADSRAYGPIRAEHIMGRVTQTRWTQFLNYIDGP